MLTAIDRRRWAVTGQRHVDTLEYRLGQEAKGSNGGTAQLAGALPSSVTAPPENVRPWNPRLFGTNVFTMFGGRDEVYLNPDELATKKGVQIYGQMIDTDDMVSAASSYLLLATLSPKWRFEAGDETPEAARAAKFQEFQAKNIKGTFQQTLLGRLDACLRGFSVGEIVWADRETEGEWDGKQRIGQIQDKNPRFIQFKLDPFGQVIEDGIVQETTIGTGTTTAKIKEVIYWPFWPKDDNPYGRPLLRPAYDPWFIKRFANKLWARREEQRGHPPLVVQWDKDDRPSDDDIKAALAFMKEWRQNLTGGLSKAFTFEKFTQERSSVENSVDIITMKNRAIARALLLPKLMIEHDGGGSLALGKSQADAFGWILEYLADQLASVWNRQAVLVSHLHNFGPRVPCPVFIVNTHKEEDLLLKAQMYSTLSLIGVPFDLRVFKDIFGDAIAIQEKLDDGKADEDQTVGGRPAGGGILRQEQSVLGRAFTPLPPQIPGMRPQDVSNFTEMVYEAVKGKLRAEKVYSFASTIPRKPMTAIEKEQNFQQQEQDNEDDLRDTEMNHILVTEIIGTEIANLASEESGARLPR